MGGAALFVIDVQKVLASSAREIPHAARIQGATQTLLEHVSRQRQRQLSSGADVVDVYFVQHEETPDSGDLVHGTTPSELVYQHQEDGRMVGKNTCRQAPPKKHTNMAISTNNIVRC